MSTKPLVLLVEDDALIRLDAVETLIEAGFAVLDAANARQALDLLSAHDDITILFTDIEMPGTMDGLRLAELVRARWPRIKIVVTSGHPRFRADIEMPGAFIPKPYDTGRVAQTLRALTGA